MEYVLKSIAVLVLGILINGCTQLADDKTFNGSHNNFNSTLWVQTSAEYRANSLQTYNTATRNLALTAKNSTGTAALEQTGRYTSLPPAVILDIDETVLNNSQYDAELIMDNGEYNSDKWDQWVSLKQATAIPGAVHFIKYAKSIGVEVIFITNRECKKREGSKDTCPQQSDTIDNLEKVGIVDVSPANILLQREQQDWSAEKESRRKFVAEKYRIVMLFGDDLGDFLPNVKNNITPEQRASLVSEHAENWGSIWYILANPKYGSCLSILGSTKSNYLKGY